MIYRNETGCMVTRSEITGDILCRWPGEDCDCMMQKIDGSYASCSEEVLPRTKMNKKTKFSN